MTDTTEHNFVGNLLKNLFHTKLWLWCRSFIQD